MRLISASFLLLAGVLSAQTSRPSYDLVIHGGTIIDGTATAGRRADLAIRGDRIAAIGDLKGSTATRTLDAAGLVVAPGFIDVHTHIDAEMVKRPAASNFVAMGVTSVISGNCGGSELDLEAHFAAVAEKGCALNYGSLLGAGTVRNAVLKTARRKPTPDELAKMRDLVRAAMRAGAFGLSTGLIYVPGSYARADELIELCKAVHEFGGLYVSHMRNEDQGVLAAIDEALQIGTGSGCPVHISHLKASGKPVWGWSSRILTRLREARANGQRVTGDQYAYTASSTSLDVLFPDAELEIGRKEFAKRLTDDAEFRQRMGDALGATMRRAGFGDLSYAHIATAHGHEELAGKSLKEAAQTFFGTDDPAAQAQAAIKLFVDADGRRVSMVYHKMCEEDVVAFLKEPWLAVASDAGIRGEGPGKPHPRGSGNNVRVLGRYVREQRVIPLELAVHKMTEAPAKAFGIPDRGRLCENAFADIVVFDAATVEDRATYEEPLASPLGIACVIVNGVVVAERGRQHDVLPGRILSPARR